MSQGGETIGTRLVVDAGRASRRVTRYRLTELAGHARAVEVSTPSFRIGTREGNDLLLDDSTVSRFHLEIVATSAGFLLRDLGSTNGTWIDGLRVIEAYLRPGSVIQIGSVTLRFDPLPDEAPVPTSSHEQFGRVLGRSAAMREIFSVLERASSSDATIMLEGESGTGKELVAEAIHRMSRRGDGPYVVFDCAAVPSSLVESALLGHEKGAFTGADARHVGLFEEADSGTIFLDEIGELPLDQQPKLLRVLERREIRRVGGTTTHKVDVRIVAATNRDLAREVNRGAFREDLYYRLAVVRVVLPALRERTDDIPLLVERFVRDCLPSDPGRAQQVLGGISEENWQRLLRHPWPGNVRELRNFIERTVALSRPGAPMDTEGLPGMAAAPAGEVARPGGQLPATEGAIDIERPFIDVKAETLARFEREYLTSILERHAGNISRAAAAAGLDRMYFKRLLKKHLVRE
ncbi:MAG: sigma 54-interacting transcriptional regulator [Deltaproteobacteria bacterium]|nr:sigma 54-interacting transcriptional regulator [Deltaproteobacteria bacterium]